MRFRFDEAVETLDLETLNPKPFDVVMTGMGFWGSLCMVEYYLEPQAPMLDQVRRRPVQSVGKNFLLGVESLSQHFATSTVDTVNGESNAGASLSYYSLYRLTMILATDCSWVDLRLISYLVLLKP